MATHKRSRTGCWTCREAGYKCDEQKPHCGRCIRLNILCKGYGVKLKWQDNNISTPIKRPKRAKRKGVVGQDGSATPASSMSVVSTPATIASPLSFKASPASTYSLPLLSIASPVVPSDVSANDRWLLQYWVERLSGLISMTPRHDQTTPFRLHLTAMAQDSAALRSTILSMAANHLALSSGDSSFRVQSYRHQRDAIQSLQGMLTDPFEAGTEPALATVLMMQVSSRLFGDEDESVVANHLAGAQAMINRHDLDGGRPSSSTMRFLLSLFAYHDILSSVSRGSRPLLDHNSNFTAIEGEQDLEGIAKILLIVARISRLQQTIKERRHFDPTTALSEEENMIGMSIQQNLLSMDFATVGDAGIVETEVQSTAEAYRHAAFIYLYRTWLEIGAPNPISMDHVHRCLDIIKEVNIDSPLTTAHVWPLFTAGCEAIDAERRQFVRSRFEEMYASKRFSSLRRVMRDIEDVWAAKDMEKQMKGRDGMAKVDCIQVILRRRGREVDLS